MWVLVVRRGCGRREAVGISDWRTEFRSFKASGGLILDLSCEKRRVLRGVLGELELCILV